MGNDKNKKKNMKRQSTKHLPLSKHIPKDILSSSTQGASKNLLGPTIENDDPAKVPSKLTTFGFTG